MVDTNYRRNSIEHSVSIEEEAHQYPRDLAIFVRDRWQDEVSPLATPADSLLDAPSLPVLQHVISTCYQASLLREESRTVTFRVIVADPEHFPAEHGPPTGLHRLVFAEPLPFTAHELRRLSPAARFHRSLIGVQYKDGNYQIWGVIHSGPRWLTSLHGGRGSGPNLPPFAVVSVPGPGHVEVARGSQTVGQLSNGKVFGTSMNVFESQWLQDFFTPIRTERMSLHQRARRNAAVPWAELDADLTRIIDQNMMKRVIAAIRAFHQGGILVLVPPDHAQELLEKNESIYLKYKFVEGEPRARFRTLIVEMMNTLAELGGRGAKGRSMSWEQYEKTHDRKVMQLDEAIFEMSHMIAGLSTVDGAVVMSKRFELLGFGGEIRCDLSEVTTVTKALDVEGKRSKIESVLGVGTRHRSAYALCHNLREALAIVISQDGEVRFARWNGKSVMYWDHQAVFTFSSRF